MEIYKIQDDNVYLIYHSGENVKVGSQYEIIERTDESSQKNGILVQVIANDSLDYPGIIQEIIQDSLEKNYRIQTKRIIDKEPAFTDVKSLKLAHAKIRKQIKEDKIIDWEGWIPTRNVSIEEIKNDVIVSKLISASPVKFPLNICKLEDKILELDSSKLDMINVITGVKGSGKSHTAKNILLRLVNMGVPCIVFDINKEYDLGNVVELSLGKTFKLDMSQMEPIEVFRIINDFFPLPDRTKDYAENNIDYVFNKVKRRCLDNNLPFKIDLDLLMQDQTLEQLIPGKQDYINGMRMTLRSALNRIKDRNIFASREESYNLRDIYNECINEKKFILVNLGEIQPKLRSILVRTINTQISKICDEEYKNGTHRYPFIFFEEAHIYIDTDAIVDFTTRGRHIGTRMFFMTNTPDALPEMVFRQLDNLFLLRLTHTTDIKHVSKSSFTDEETVTNFATRMPRHHLLIIGNITNNYPLVAQGSPLPIDVKTGATRPLWEHLEI